MGALFDRIKSVVQTMSQQQGLPKIEPGIEPGVPGEPPQDVPAAPVALTMDEWEPQANMLGTIRIAARKRLLVQMTYNGVSRLVEPYSLRPGKYGVLFFGYCRLHDKIHSFRIDRIDSVSISDIGYIPRWVVELTS
jgi:predicted DNA-binding transcriptional regulator YafY